MQRYIPLILFFASGFSALMLEILWMQQLGVLFGSSTYAASITLGVFFAGLAVGSHYWGHYAIRTASPLRTYGLLELAVSASALVFLLLFNIFSWIYDDLFSLLGSSHALFTLSKSLLAVFLIFPAAFFMGGTLPAMGQFFIQKKEQLGKLGSYLYAINTFGAALGAFTTGFIFFPKLGFATSYIIAVLLVAGIATLAVMMSLSIANTKEQLPSQQEQKIEPLARWLLQLSFFSGFISLSLQVLWTRMFAQVLHNSVYTYATILVMFLLSIGIGALLAHRMIHQDKGSERSLFILCCSSGLAVAASPFLFYALTGGLNYIGEGEHWLSYLFTLSSIAVLCILVPGILMGSLFPFLFRFAQTHGLPAGKALGQLNAINTLGAITGSIAAGFILLNFLGLWPSIRLMALAYLLLALILFPQYKSKLSLVPALGILALFTILDSAQLPSIRIDPIKEKEALMQLWEGPSGTVAVVNKNDSLQIKVNNYYTLGSTRSQRYEERQGRLPLLIHGQAKSVYFIGMGTGITAGAALQHPVSNLVVTELIPEVITASKLFFAPQTHGLHKDKRVRVIPEDGRNFLRASKQNFDVVVADLFVPWRAGIGSVYTVEHFTQVKQRLNAQGIFVQWLPLYQLTYEEFAIIVNSFLRAFPDSQLWRGDFFAKKPVVALVGHKSPGSFNLSAIKDQIDTLNQGASADPRLHLLFYCGNLGKIAAVFKDYPVNTDDNRMIEFAAPYSHRKVQAKESHWFVGKPLIEFLAYLLRTAPPEQDAYFSQTTGKDLDYVRAGFYLQQYNVLRASHEAQAAQQALNEFKIITGIDQVIK